METPRRSRVPRAVAACLFDGGSGVPLERLDALLHDLDAWSADAGPRLRFALWVAGWVIQLTPLLTLRRPARFTSLSPPERERHLSTLEMGALAKPYLGLKTVLAILYFEQPGSGLPAQVRKPRVVDPPPDPLQVRLGPEGPLPGAGR